MEVARPAIRELVLSNDRFTDQGGNATWIGQPLRLPEVMESTGRLGRFFMQHIRVRASRCRKDDRLGPSSQGDTNHTRPAHGYIHYARSRYGTDSDPRAFTRGESACQPLHRDHRDPEVAWSSPTARSPHRKERSQESRRRTSPVIPATAKRRLQELLNNDFMESLRARTIKIDARHPKIRGIRTTRRTHQGAHPRKQSRRHLSSRACGRSVAPRGP